MAELSGYTIGALPLATEAQQSDMLEIERDGQSLRVTAQMLADLAGGSVTTPILIAHSSTQQYMGDGSRFYKMAVNTATTDTVSGFSAAANRYTPGQVGIYQIDALVSPAYQCNWLRTTIRVNGSDVLYPAYDRATSEARSVAVSGLIVVSAPTDYIELWAQAEPTGVYIAAGPLATRLHVHKVG